MPPSRFGKAYLTAVPWLGTAVLLWALVDLLVNPPDSSWWALAALTILTGSFTVKIPGLVARLSVSEPFVFAATLWFGPSVGAVTAALDALIMSLWLMPGLKTLHRLTFNVSVLVISVWTASQVFFGVSGIDVRNPEYSSLATFVGPLYLFTACCFLLNSGMVATALAIERRRSAVRIWREQFLWLSLNYFGGASVAALLVVYAKSIDWAVIGLIIPLLAISYLTFRTTLGRLDDANQHLNELNQLHLSTIEALAMAVDAKDQVTHGHIRRVQKYALGLSDFLGVTDEKLLKAIEAAALLHDMGKLAIPEYILNKPGRLTPAEFDKMKLHAGLGADILSSIDFPYPVIPIVRHHHENWDGTGYPAGLRGTEIPLGARVLSVVDCFDALTSDRPYRPKLSTDEAIAIIMQRRGTMYDPLVVDVFVSRLSALEEAARDHEPANETLLQIAELNAPQPKTTPNRRGPQLSAAIGSTIHSILDQRDIAPLALGLTSDRGGIVGTFFAVEDRSSTELHIVSAAGAFADALVGYSVEPGSKVIGWAAATENDVVNADAELEFGHASDFRSLKCSVFPVSQSDGSKAVLGFLADHQQPTEVDASRLAAISVSLVGALRPSDRAVASLSPIHGDSIVTLLPKDRVDAEACFPIGVIAVQQKGPTKLDEAAARTLVRSGDTVTTLQDGTIVFILRRVTDISVRAIVARLGHSCRQSDVKATIEWTVLDEFADAAQLNPSRMAHFIPPRSTHSRRTH